MKIALDAGHGHGDPGAYNPRLNLTEDVAAYEIMQAVKAHLSGFQVIETDRELYSSQRAQEASNDGAGALVSIHLNAGSIEARGFEVWFHHDNIGGEKLADSIDRSMATFLPVNRGIKDDYYWRPPENPNWTGGMGILREFRGPACLVEVLFISNDEEARQLLDPLFIDQIGGKIAMGIAQYVRQPEFPDVKDPEVRVALTKLCDLQIVKGFPDGTFKPDEPLTRGQAVLIIQRVLKYLGKE